MGYYTYFDGEIVITPQLKAEHLAYLKAFTQSRRMKRDEVRTMLLPDPVREAVRLPVSVDGGYFVGDSEASVIDHNTQPCTQPSLWCDWVFHDDGMTLTADDGKNYGYVEWLNYLIENFLHPWGYELNGLIHWRGESDDDLGQIVVEKNAVETRWGRVEYNDRSIYRVDIKRDGKTVRRVWVVSTDRADVKTVVDLLPGEEMGEISNLGWQYHEEVA